MTNMTKDSQSQRLKVAVIREPGHPIGDDSAPLYLNCPCGTRPATRRVCLDSHRVTCSGCGTVYTADGWVVSR